MDNRQINRQVILFYAAPSVAMIDQCLPIMHEMSKNSNLIKVIAFREAEVLNQLKSRETLNSLVAESFDFFLVPGRFRWKLFNLNIWKKDDDIREKPIIQDQTERAGQDFFKLNLKILDKLSKSSKYRKIYKRIFSHSIKLNKILKTNYKSSDIVVVTDIEIMHKFEAQKHLKKFIHSKWISFPHGIVLDDKSSLKQNAFHKNFNQVYFFSKTNINYQEDKNLNTKIKLIPVPRHSDYWLNTLNISTQSSNFCDSNSNDTVLLVSSVTNGFRKGEKYQYLIDILNTCKDESLNLLVLTHPKENDFKIFDEIAREIDYSGIINHLKTSIFNLNFRPYCAISFGSTVDFDILRLGFPLMIHHDFRFDNKVEKILTNPYCEEDVLQVAEQMVHITDRIALDRLKYKIASWSFNYEGLSNNIKKARHNSITSEHRQKYEEFFLPPASNNSELIHEMTKAN